MSSHGVTDVQLRRWHKMDTNGIEVATRRTNMGAPKNQHSVALGANLRIGDEHSFNRVGDALRKCVGQLDGPHGACQRLKVAHRTFMRWRKDIPRLELLVQEVRAEIAALRARAAKRAAENTGESDDSGTTEETSDDASADDSAGDADGANDATAAA